MASRWPRRIRRYPIPMYGGRLAFCLSREDYAQCAAALGDSGDAIEWAKESVGVTQLYDPAPGHRCATHLVGLFDGDPGTLVHELVHVACNVLRLAAVPLTKDNDEVLAHLMDTLVGIAIKNAASRPSGIPGNVNGTA